MQEYIAYSRAIAEALENLRADADEALVELYLVNN
jgi:hypothetical protein